MTKEEMLAKIQELKEAEAMIKELETEVESLKDELKAEMNAQGKDEMQVDIWTVRYKDVISNRIDSKSLKKDLPSVYEKYAKATTSKRFTVA